MQINTYGTKYLLDGYNHNDRRGFRYTVGEGMSASCEAHHPTETAAVCFGKVRVNGRICPICRKVFLPYRSYATWKYLTVFRSLLSNWEEIRQQEARWEERQQLSTISPVGSPDYTRLSECEICFIPRELTEGEVSQNGLILTVYENPLYDQKMNVYFSAEDSVMYMTIDSFHLVAEDLVSNVCTADRPKAFPIAQDIRTERRIRERELEMSGQRKRFYRRGPVNVEQVQGIRRRMPGSWIGTQK